MMMDKYEWDQNGHHLIKIDKSHRLPHGIALHSHIHPLHMWRCSLDVMMICIIEIATG